MPALFRGKALIGHGAFDAKGKPYITRVTDGANAPVNVPDPLPIPTARKLNAGDLVLIEKPDAPNGPWAVVQSNAADNLAAKNAGILGGTQTFGM